ncbi:MAG: ABC transporter ATP-binding protein [Dehalococcoidia bacterium]|nr:MAG: ABC transporter ATP-binding protein [Dehalococcoidia bacterium]
MAFLEVENLEAYYGKAQALKNVSFSVEKGGCIGIIGPNGAGKSTLLDSIIGLTHWEGKIIFDGVDLHGLPPRKIIKLGIGYAPERGNLFTFMNVKENLSVGAYLARDKMDENFASVYEMLPLLDERQKQQAGTLSGGERQMLSLGRAWMSDPRLLLLDEPTLGLAPIVISKIAVTIEDLKKRGATIIIAEQNVSFTSAHADRLYLLERGTLTMGGTAEELKGEEYVRKTYFGV